MTRAGVRFQIFLAAAAAAAMLLLTARPADAATVVNGGFESGSLDGWQLVNEPPEGGSWYAYTGTTIPVEFEPTVPPPPEGNFAASTFQGGPGTRIMYQDVSLEPDYSHQLSLFVYYRTPLSVPETPEPNSLQVEGESGPPNEQYRIDVIKPSASIYSLAPGDVLATVFATKTGDPAEMSPTKFTTDLTPFAGQTVRLRFAEVDNNGTFLAGTDAVSIASTAPPPPPAPIPSNAFSLGKPSFNKKKGTARLPINVPGAGIVQVEDSRKAKKQIKATVLRPSAAGTLLLLVKPNKKGRKTLLAKNKLPVKLAVTFTPNLGTAATQTRKLVLKRIS